MGLTTLDFVVIVAYFAGMAGIGIYFAGRQTSRDEYFLGGRRIHWALAGGSILATLLSTISYLSLPGEMIRYGFGYFAGVLAVPLAVPLMSYTLLPAMRRLRISSAYEYLERRFHAQVRTLAGSIFLIRTVLWMGLIIYTASFAMVEVTGWNIYVTIVVIGIVTTFYTSAGGLQSVIWTDNLQLLILFGGALLIPVFIGLSLDTGPLAWWDSFSQAGRSEIQAFSWDPMIRVTLFGALMSQFFWNVCTQGSDQVAVQRLLSTPTLKAARQSLWMYAVANVILLFLLAVAGLALFAYYAAESGLPIQEFQEKVAPEADKLMPRFIVQVLPPGVSGLLVAALLAAAMSSLSSGINSISSVISSDFMKRSGAGEGESLWFDRFSGVAAGLTGIAIACVITKAMETSDWNLVELTGRVNHIFVGPIGVLFFAGTLFRRAGITAVLAGFAASTAISLFVCFGREWFGLEQSVSFLWVVPASFVGGLVAAKLVSLVTAPPPDEKTRGLTYLSNEGS